MTRKNKIYDKFAIVPDVFRIDIEDNNYINDFHENHLLLLVYIQQYLTVMNRDINFTFRWFIDDLNISNSKTINNLKKCFYDLDDWKLIEWKNKSDRLNMNTKINCRLNKVNDDASFTLLNYNYVDKIMKSKEDIRSKKIMLYLYTIIQSYKGNKQICYPSYKLLKTTLKTNADTTITTNLEKLRDLNIIDFGNAGFQGNKQKSFNNIYITCDTENYKTILDEEINKKRCKKPFKTDKYKNINPIKNKNISKTMRMNSLVKKWDNDEISDSEKEELLMLEKDYFFRKIETAVTRQQKLDINSKLRMYTLDVRLKEYEIPCYFLNEYIDNVCEEHDYNLYYDSYTLIMYYEKEIIRKYVELNPNNINSILEKLYSKIKYTS